VANFNSTPGATSAVGGWGFVISQACSTNGIAYELLAADTSNSVATNLYVIGLYCVSGDCTAGSLYTTTGELPASTFAPPASLNTVVTQPWTGGNFGPPPITLPAGLYMLTVGVNGCTTSSYCPVIASETWRGSIYPFFACNVATYSSGLPPNIVPPAISPVANTSIGARSILEIAIY
jgi:hypothetical protein